MLIFSIFKTNGKGARLENVPVTCCTDVPSLCAIVAGVTYGDYITTVRYYNGNGLWLGESEFWEKKDAHGNLALLVKDGCSKFASIERQVMGGIKQ